MEPAVSICIPTYNGAHFLAGSLDSALAQTRGDFEVLVVDDCSTDDSVAIAMRYAERDERVRVVRNERNLGLVGNWNRSIELARGTWIKFLFQDDLLAPTCLERMMEAGERGNVIVACGRNFLFDPSIPQLPRKQYEGHRVFLDRHLSEATTAEQFSGLALDHVDINLLGEPTAVLLHRDVFKRFGYFNELMVQVVDSEYWARVATVVGVTYLADTLATFRVHPASTSSLNNGPRRARMLLDRLVVRHEYAYSPAYESLRAVSRSTRPTHDLHRQFWFAAYEALIVDGVAATLRRADARTKDEVKRVYGAYPRLTRIRRFALRYMLAKGIERYPLLQAAYMGAKRIITRST